MKNSFFVFLISFVASFCFSQEINYELNGLNKRSISKEKIGSVVTLNDLNEGFPSSWIDRYITVEISSDKNEMISSALGEGNKLNEKQLYVLENSSIGSTINVFVKYYPKHSCSNIAKEINFSLEVVPKTQASYPGGHEGLKEYLSLNAMDKLPLSKVKNLALVSTKFTVDENGNIIDSRISNSSGDSEVDELLLKVISHMSPWQPAQTADGKYVQQEFELNLGYMIGC